MILGLGSNSLEMGLLIFWRGREEVMNWS